MTELRGTPEVRGAQSLVHTLARCWKRPSLLGLEVLWRWAFGAPALWVVCVQLKRILMAHAGGVDGGLDFSKLGLDASLVRDPVGSAAADPMGVSAKVADALRVLWPDLLRVAVWLAPLLMAIWTVVSSVGRTLVLRRMDSSLHVRVGTLIGLQMVRVAALAASFAAWVECLRCSANIAVTRPIAAAEEPNLVLYFALMIVATLGLFTAWGFVSWALSLSPLVAMLQDVGVGASLAKGFRLGALRGKLVEVNLVMGIVKIALIVLAMVFSATPLPFESVASEEFLRNWWIGVTVLYLVGSDFFHVARMMAYLELWRVYER